MFGSPGLRNKSMLSAAIHYATLNSFRSIKLPISLYKPPDLMLAFPHPFERGDTLAGCSAKFIQPLLQELQGFGEVNQSYLSFIHRKWPHFLKIDAFYFAVVALYISVHIISYCGLTYTRFFLPQLTHWFCIKNIKKYKKNCCEKVKATLMFLSQLLFTAETLMDF